MVTWELLGIFGVGVLLTRLCKRVSPVFVMLTVYVCASAIAFQVVGAPEFNSVGNAVFKGYSARAFLFATGAVLAVLLAPKRVWLFLEPLFAILCAGSILMVLGQAVLDSESIAGGYGGLINNPSMNGAFIVTTLPFLMLELSLRPSLCYFALAGAAGAVVLSMSSMPLALFGVYLVSSYLRSGARELYIPATLIGGIGVAHEWPRLLDTNGRSAFWKYGMDWWEMNVNPLVGAGFGSTTPRMSDLAAFHGKPPVATLHSDWLQFLFELGWVGLVLAGAVYLTVLYRHWQTPRYRTAWLTVGICGLFNFPLHVPIYSLVIAYLAIHALRKRSDTCDFIY